MNSRLRRVVNVNIVSTCQMVTAPIASSRKQMTLTHSLLKCGNFPCTHLAGGSCSECNVSLVRLSVINAALKLT